MIRMSTMLRPGLNLVRSTHISSPQYEYTLHKLSSTLLKSFHKAGLAVPLPRNGFFFSQHECLHLQDIIFKSIKTYLFEWGRAKKKGRLTVLNYVSTKMHDSDHNIKQKAGDSAKNEKEGQFCHTNRTGLYFCSVYLTYK